VTVGWSERLTVAAAIARVPQRPGRRLACARSGGTFARCLLPNLRSDSRKNEAQTLLWNVFRNHEFGRTLACGAIMRPHILVALPMLSLTACAPVTERRVVNPPGISPLAPAYSVAIRQGDMVFVSGMIGI
jgi:enamine deaminase RidA (YjgF/YER057c/UK114 family)